MAQKLFTNIANVPTQEQRVQNSTVNSGWDRSATFSELRTNRTDAQITTRLISGSLPRVTPLFELYTGSFGKSFGPLVPQTKIQDYGTLFGNIEFRRDRPTAFYRSFRRVREGVSTFTPILNESGQAIIQIFPDSPDSSEANNDTRLQTSITTSINDSGLTQTEKTSFLDILTNRLFNSNANRILNRSEINDISRENPTPTFIARDVFRVGALLARKWRFTARQKELQTKNTFGQSANYKITTPIDAILRYGDVTLENPTIERVTRANFSTANGQGVLNLEPIQGRLQKQTVITVQNKLQFKYVGGSTDGQQSNTVQNTENFLAKLSRNQILTQPIPTPGIFQNGVNFLNRAFGARFSVGSTFTLGQVGNRIQDIRRFTNSFVTNRIDDKTLLVNQTAYDALYQRDLWPLLKQPYGNSTDGSPTILSFTSEKEIYIQRARNTINADAQQRTKGQINRFNKQTEPHPTDDYRSSADFTQIIRSNTAARASVNGNQVGTYLRDELNPELQNNNVKALEQLLTNTNAARDYIKVVFQVPSVFDKGIVFRAMLEDFNHSAQGEYESIRYVGRPERFINYRGMSRSVTFSLWLIAFSARELDTVWARCNMLNKLVYPIDNSGGFMTPPFVKLTIGNVLNEQPGYVENIDMRLQDVPWDIDKELPQLVKVNLKYNIIEKAYITQAGTNYAEATQLFNQATSPATPAATGTARNTGTPRATTSVPDTARAVGDAARRSRDAGLSLFRRA